ncbi:MAG: sterol carrier protein domain-containing protein [Nocardiopsaceae bacterium]|nr:sterol carrier protein domain-containing protein [Nocardiopsaceae bacterium]
MAEPSAARELFPAIHEDARRGQIGDVRTYPGKWDELIQAGPLGGRYMLLCREDLRPSGYAVYRLEREERYSSHASVVVEHLISCTDASYRRLWAHLANLDLTDCVLARGRPEHEALQWMLSDRRQMIVTDVHDHLWLRLVDVADALSLRRYGTAGTLRLRVRDSFCPWNSGCWLLAAGWWTR